MDKLTYTTTVAKLTPKLQFWQEHGKIMYILLGRVEMVSKDSDAASGKAKCNNNLKNVGTL